MPIAAPTIDMRATGANIRALIKDKGLKVTGKVDYATAKKLKII